MTSHIVIDFLLAYGLCCDVSCIAMNDPHFAGPNIAYHKRAYQRPGTYEDTNQSYSYPASLAVDGNDDSDFSHRSCSQTSGTMIDVPSQHIAQWIVNLGGEFIVTGIVIVNRKDLKDRLKNFVVFGYNVQFCSNTTNWCQLYDDKHDNMYTRDKIYIPVNTKQSYSSIAINLPKHHGYPDNGLSYLTLCEVMIFAVTCMYKTITNGYLYPTQTLYGMHEKVSITCNEGFQPNSRETVCLNTGLWSVYQPVCKKKQCPYPGNIDNGVYRFENGSLYSSGFSYYNTTVYTECNKGYIVSDSKFTCRSDKTWGGISKCFLVTCDFPKLPKNGVYASKDMNGTYHPYAGGQSAYLAIIQILCPARYFLNSTTEVRQCLETGVWSGEPGSCISVTCKNLEELEGGFYHYTKAASSDGYPFNTTVTAYCNATFQLSDNYHKIRRCTEKGVWDKEPVSCVAVVSETKGEKKMVVIAACISAAAVVILSAVVAFVLYRKCRQHQKTCRQQEEIGQNIYTDLSSQTRSNDSEYSHIQETQLHREFNGKDRAPNVEDNVSKPAEKEHPFYCNVVF